MADIFLDSSLQEPTHVNLKLLYVFIAVADLGSFRLAAERLNKSESAVSLQIRQLEEQLGVPLFHRTTRQVRLTGEGEEMLRASQRALAELNGGLRRLRGSAELLSGTLSVGCVPTVAATRLPIALARFQKRYPGVSIRLRELPAKELLESLQDFSLDFGIGPRTATALNLQFEHVCDDGICAVSHDTFGLPARLTLKELSAMPLLLNANITALRSDLEKLFEQQSLTLKISYEVLHTHTVIALALAGLGVALVPAIALPDVLPQGVRVSRLVQPDIKRSLGILTGRGQALSPAATKLLDFVREAMTETPG